MKRPYYIRGCRRCGGVGTKLPVLIGGKWWGGDDGLPCRDCKGEGIRRYIYLGQDRERMTGGTA